jgi:hypothetical protein
MIKLIDAFRYYAIAPQNNNEVTCAVAQKKVLQYKMFMLFIRDGTVHK